jgi:hypothetical protein
LQPGGTHRTHQCGAIGLEQVKQPPDRHPIQDAQGLNESIGVKYETILLIILALIYNNLP